MQGMQGGADLVVIPDTAFKYTQSPQRRAWVKRTFPLGVWLIQAIQRMPWHEYAFDGTVRLAHYMGENPANANKPLFERRPLLEWKPHHVRATTMGPEIPYHYFGGCVYEILNSIHGPTLSLHDFVDPTGDIDVSLHRPFLNVLDRGEPADNSNNEGDVDIPDYMYIEDADGHRTMNEFVADWTAWVYRQFIQQLEAIPQRIWDLMFGEAVSFDVTENAEAAASDLRTWVRDRVWVVRVPELERGMVKVQMVVKFPEVAAAEHLVEFVFVVSDTELELPRTKTKHNAASVSLIHESIPVESFKQLIDGNEDSLKKRAPLRQNAALSHKFFNHVSRMQYLNLLIPRVAALPNTDQRLAFSIARFIKLVFEVGDNVCNWSWHDTCNRRELLGSMVDGLVPYLFREGRDRFGRKQFIQPYGFAKRNGVQYDMYQILAELQVAVGGRRRRSKTRRRCRI